MWEVVRWQRIKAQSPNDHEEMKGFIVKQARWDTPTRLKRKWKLKWLVLALYFVLRIRNSARSAKLPRPWHAAHIRPVFKPMDESNSVKFIDLSHSARTMRNILEENGYVVVSGVLGDANIKQAMKLAGDFLGATKRAEQALSGDSSVSWPRVVEGHPPFPP